MLEIPLGPATSVGIYDTDRFRVCYRDMIGLDADHCAISFVGSIDGEVASSSTGMVQKPQVGEASGQWSGNVADRSIA